MHLVDNDFAPHQSLLLSQHQSQQDGSSVAASAELYNVLRKLHDSIDQLQCEDIDPMLHNGVENKTTTSTTAADAPVLSGGPEKQHRLSDPFLPEERELVERLLTKYGHLDEEGGNTNEVKYDFQQQRFPSFPSEGLSREGAGDEVMFSSKVKIRGTSPHHSRKGSVKRTASKSTLNSLTFVPASPGIAENNGEATVGLNIGARTSSSSNRDMIREEPLSLHLHKQSSSSDSHVSPTSPVKQIVDDVFDSNSNSNKAFIRNNTTKQSNNACSTTANASATHSGILGGVRGAAEEDFDPHQEHHQQQHMKNILASLKHVDPQNTNSSNHNGQQQQQQQKQQRRHRGNNRLDNVKETELSTSHNKQLHPLSLTSFSGTSTPCGTPKNGAGTPNMNQMTRTRKVSTVREFAMRFEAAQQQQQQQHQQHGNRNDQQQQQQQQHPAKRFFDPAPRFNVMPEPKNYHISSSSSETPSESEDEDMSSNSSSSEYEDNIVKTNEGFIIPDEAIHKRLKSHQPTPMSTTLIMRVGMGASSGGTGGKAQRMREEQEEIERQFKKENFLKDLPTSRRGIRMPTGSAGKVNQLKSKFEGTGMLNF